MNTACGASPLTLHQFVAAYAAPLPLRFNLNAPSMQRVHHEAITPRGRQNVAFGLLSPPLYQVEHVATSSNPTSQSTISGARICTGHVQTLC
jgi:hypothetical protein